MGNGVPHRDLTVSRHHRLLLTSKITQRMYGKPEVLAAAKDLTAIEGIDIAPVKAVITYYHILVQDHEILFAEGAPAESLYLGKEALNAMEPASHKELRQIFGTAWGRFITDPPPTARQLVQGNKLRNLVGRYHKNNIPLSANLTQ